MKKVPEGRVLQDLLELYKDLLVPFMKVRRDIPFPSEPDRQETDAEHVFTLGVLSITLAEALGLKLDTGLIAKYVLAHDLVEAYAGDVSARASKKDHAQKAVREHKAYNQIKKRYGKTAPWLVELIERYEARADQEAKFVYASDKLMGALSRMAGDGARWAEYYPEPNGSSYHKVVKLLRQKAQTYPELIEFFDYVHDQLDRRRIQYLKN